MAKGLSFTFTLNPREFVRGLKVIETGLDDLQDDLRDVERSGDGLGDSLQDEARQAERAFERFGREASASMDRVERAARDIDVAGGSFKGNARALAAEGADEFIESWGEAIRQGNPAGAISETLTQGLAIGAAVGGPVALGIGAAASIVGGIVQGMNAEKERLKAVASDIANSLFDRWAEGGYQAGVDAGEAALRGLLDSQEEAGIAADILGKPLVEALVQIEGWARKTGLSTNMITEALAGNEAAAEQVRSVYQSNVDEITRIEDAILTGVVPAGYASVEAAAAERDRRIEVNNTLSDVLPKLATAAASAQEAATASGVMLSNYQASVTALGQAAGATGQLNQALLQTARLNPDFSALAGQLGYAAANAQLLSAALGTITDPSQLQGVARGALMR